MNDGKDNLFITRDEVFELVGALAGAVMKVGSASAAAAAGDAQRCFDLNTEASEAIGDMINIMIKITADAREVPADGS